MSKSHLTFLCHLVPHQHRLGALSVSVDLEGKGKFLKVKKIVSSLKSFVKKNCQSDHF